MNVNDTHFATSFNFRSDNVAPVAPEILGAIGAVNLGSAAGYGKDQWSVMLQRKFSELFEKDVAVFPVCTGTAANALSLASIARPWGGIYCHELAHIHTTEGGATEAFTGGAKLITLAAHDCKLEPTSLAEALAARSAAHAMLRNLMPCRSRKRPSMGPSTRLRRSQGSARAPAMVASGSTLMVQGSRILSLRLDVPQPRRPGVVLSTSFRLERRRTEE